MKVYGWVGHARGMQWREIMAARSWAEVARHPDAPGLHYLRTYGGETWNDAEVEAATARPGVLLRRPLDDRNAPYEPVQ